MLALGFMLRNLYLKTVSRFKDNLSESISESTPIILLFKNILNINRSVMIVEVF